MCVLTWWLTWLTWQGEKLEEETVHLFSLYLWRVNQFDEWAEVDGLPKGALC